MLSRPIHSPRATRNSKGEGYRIRVGRYHVGTPLTKDYSSSRFLPSVRAEVSIEIGTPTSTVASLYFQCGLRLRCARSSFFELNAKPSTVTFFCATPVSGAVALAVAVPAGQSKVTSTVVLGRRSPRCHSPR